MAAAELVMDARARLAEGPWWDSRAELLYWIDIEGLSLHAFDPANGSDARVAEFESKPGTVVGRAGGGLLVALADGLARVDPSSGSVRMLFDPEPDKTGNRFNDGKCDAAGRLWVGTMADSCEGREGALYRVGADLSCERMLDRIGISNGLGWSPDGRTMYFIDTPTRKVDAFDFDEESGAISRRRTVVAVPHGMGSPDGMTVDGEGMLWIALWMGWGLGRWDPGSGQLVEKVDVPAARTTSCCFGGADLDTLFITTAASGSGGAEGQPCAGGLFAYRPGGLRGAASTPFAG